MVYRTAITDYHYLPPEIALKPGQVLGDKYVLNRMIGKGGMGVVWAGTNERTGKQVALKAIRRSFAPDSQVAELFRREALVASRVNHPNVVSVFDIIDHERMTCIVMELLDGEPLNEYLAREGPLSMETAAALLLPAMRGVAAANAKGVIHRDIKPHNIFVCVGPDGRVVTVKVLDFGSSLLMENAVGDAVESGQIGTVGTPAYMAPEHIQGETCLDARVDVYGFGVVFFEALTGRHPFAGPPGASVLERILHEPPLPLGELRPDLPRVVVHIIEQALAKDPDERVPSLDAFVRMVEAHLLPSSSLPRSMTPLAGVPVSRLVESNSGVADSVVQVARRSEDSALHETMAIFTLQGRTADSGDVPPRRLQLNRAEERGQGAAPSLDETSPLGGAIRRFSRKRIAEGVIFGAIVIFVIWLAFPMPGRGNPPAGPSPRADLPATVAPMSLPAPRRAPVEAGESAPEPTLPTILDGAATEVVPPGEIDQVERTPSLAAERRATDVPISRRGSTGKFPASAALRPSYGRPYKSRASTSSPDVQPAPTEPSSAGQRPTGRAGALSGDDF